ncbi:MAG TPA: GAD-like domain-containing protein, partial [Pseudomonas sp.]|nr:GAD-like domain-containing protein [Pseudomonas sp.]
MDEHFNFFLKSFSPAFDRREVPGSSIARYESKLPGQLLLYWKDHGWCGYADGIFWTVNPQEYESLLAQWLDATGIEGQDKYYVIARSAFGDLYVWGERSGYCLTISSVMSRYALRASKFTGEKIDFGVKVFFSFVRPEHNDLDGLFKFAL